MLPGWTDRRMDEDVVHPDNRLYYSALRKDRHSDTCYRLDEPGGYYAPEISQSQKDNVCMYVST